MMLVWGLVVRRDAKIGEIDKEIIDKGGRKFGSNSFNWYTHDNKV